jgi:hypothetical protein
VQLIDLYILYALSTALIQVSLHSKCFRSDLLPLWELSKDEGIGASDVSLLLIFAVKSG